MNGLGSSKKEPLSKNQEIIPQIVISTTFRREKKCCDCGGHVSASDISRKQGLLFGSEPSSKCGKCLQKSSDVCTTTTDGIRKSINVFVQYSTKMTQSCSVCNEVFVSKGELLKHMETHGQCVMKGKRVKKKLTCSDCNQIFNRRADLQLHRRTEHSQKRNVCPVCKKTFDTEKRLKMHSQFHNVGGEFKCFYCNKQFNKGWKLKIHLVNHTGKAPFYCESCGEDFLYPGKIAIHMKEFHDLWNVCKGCGAAFKYWYDYNRHVCKFYCCKDCSMCFETFDELAAHAASHSKNDSSERPQEVPSNVDVNSSNTEGNVLAQNLHNEVMNKAKEEAISGDVLAITQLGGSTSLMSYESSNPDKNVIICSYVDHPFTQTKKVVKRLINYGHCSELGKIMQNVTGDLENRIGVIDDNKRDLKKESSVCETFLLETEKEADHCSTFFRDIAMGEVISNSKVTFSVNPCNSLVEPDFKVPDASVSSEISRSIKKIGSNLKFCIDPDVKHSQKCQSLESWLTGDTPYDFVFGFGSNGRERSISCNEPLNEPHRQYINKMILKKEKSDMSFEDLCLF